MLSNAFVRFYSLNRQIFHPILKIGTYIPFINNLNVFLCERITKTLKLISRRFLPFFYYFSYLPLKIINLTHSSGFCNNLEILIFVWLFLIVKHLVDLWKFLLKSITFPFKTLKKKSERKRLITYIIYWFLRYTYLRKSALWFYWNYHNII